MTTRGGPRPGAGRKARGKSASRPFAVNLTEDEHVQLAALASRWGCTRADAARRALREALERSDPPNISH